MRDPAPADLVFSHLHLGAFAAIDQVAGVKRLQNLRRRVSVKSRYRRIISKYGKCQHLN